MVATLIDGLLSLGCKVLLLGAPGSQSDHPNIDVIDAGTPKEIKMWLASHPADFDIVHDHSNGLVFQASDDPPFAYTATSHVSGASLCPKNVIYLSRAQRTYATSYSAPFIPIPCNPDRFITSPVKENYFLFLGRVSAWKGVLEAAAFSALCDTPLMIAGPTWEKVYAKKISDRYGKHVQFVGELSGDSRLELLSRSRALLALSQSKRGPHVGLWVEPGATVVSEAAASGTPVIGSTNGCLPEIVPPVGAVIPEGSSWSPSFCINVVAGLPSSQIVLEAARERWHYLVIAQRYLQLYRLICGGMQW